jgi:CRP-like cAMP-binding protein
VIIKYNALKSGEFMFLISFASYLKNFLFSHKELDYLRKFPILEGMTSHELYLFNQITHERIFKEGEIVYQEQFPLAVVYLILSGIIEIVNNPDDPDDNILLHKHQFYGIIDMYNEKRRKGIAIAKTDSKLIAISNIDFQTFLRSNPRAGVKLMSNICKSLSKYVFLSQTGKQV